MAETSEARAAAEAVARASYGRLVATLARRTRDLSAAQDALSEAFATALRVWPEQGVPDLPDAWLLAVARRHHGHAERSAAMRLRLEPHVRLLGELDADAPEPGWPDPRLSLLFVCAHPAIDATVRAPLMLQTVLGLDAARIASAFVVSPTAMGQRLVRAKTKIRDAGLAFEVPDTDRLPERLSDVLDAVYVAYGAGWESASAIDVMRSDLVHEAIFLGRLLVDILPAEPEPKGLLALMLYCEARRAARRDEAGRFVPLNQQDTHLWDATLIMEGEALLTMAARARRYGRFQTEAAIQSVHCLRAITGETDWNAIIGLYDLLQRFSPSIGAIVGSAGALSEAGHPLTALERLAQLQPTQVETYQPYWVVRAHILHRLKHQDRKVARERALALTSDPAVRAYLTDSLS